jgi:transcription elongation factor Elf1
MEHTFTCPSCGEEISMVLDLSVSRHTYIEDCEVCCTPCESAIPFKTKPSLASTPRPSNRFVENSALL